MGGLWALALGTVLAIPGGMDPKDLEKLLVLIREGDAASVARELETAPVRQALGSDARALCDVCVGGADSARSLARNAPAAAPRVAAALLVLTADNLAANPKGPYVLSGRLHALLVDARVRKALGMPITAEPFVQAGEGLELLYQGLPADGFYLLSAARAFADGADLAGEKGAALWDRAEDMAGAIRKNHPEATESVVGGFGILLDRLRWGAARREKGLDARLDSALEYLAEPRKAAPGHQSLVTAFNDAVLLMREAGLRRPGMEFEMDRFSPCTGLQVSMPAGYRWSTSPTTYAEVFQRDLDFVRIRAIEFTTYQWDQPYDLLDGSRVRGDSMKDLAGKFFDIASKGVKKARVRRPVAAGRLKQGQPGWAFEVAGTDEKGAWVRRREWYFKSATDRRQTYRIAVIDSSPDLADDPAFQAVLDSIRESPK